jgi:site-specific DNA recombinase
MNAADPHAPKDKLRKQWQTASNGKPAYRCRHGYTTATRLSPDRPKNLYIREEQILARLAALAIILASESQPGARARSHVPVQTAGLIDQLRAASVTLTYDSATRTLRTSPGNAALTVS